MGKNACQYEVIFRYECWYFFLLLSASSLPRRRYFRSPFLESLLECVNEIPALALTSFNLQKYFPHKLTLVDATL